MSRAFISGVKRNKHGQIVCDHDQYYLNCAKCGTHKQRQCEHGRQKPSRCRACNPISWAKSILSSLKRKARTHKHVEPLTTPDEIVELSIKPNCVVCETALSWEGKGTSNTPHLHHCHKTGQVIGFSHPTCNLLEGKIKYLLKQIPDSVTFLRNAFPEVFMCKSNIAGET